MKSREQKSIAMLGLWHLGCIYSASLAKLGFKILGFDEDRQIIHNLKKGIPPISEPLLTETINKYLGKNLFFSSSVREVLRDKHYIFITYDLPVNSLDQVQTEIIEETFSKIAELSSEYSIVVISTQVPVGTSRNLVNLVKKKNKNIKVIYFPENLRLGTAFKTFLRPDRIILGSDDKGAIEQFNRDFKFNCPIFTMGLESAEMSKHALNSYLATCISLSSELSDLSEKVGANMLDVVQALKSDHRVSTYAPINPGLGFSGGTLGRDIQTLKMIGESKKYCTKLLNAVYDVNQDRLQALLEKIKLMLPCLKNKNIGLLGLTYKPNTNTLRRSMSLQLASLLSKRGCNIKAYDPAITKKILSYSFIKVQRSFESFFKDLDIIILMTDWQKFKEIDILNLSPLMKNKLIVDTKNFLDKDKYQQSGFLYQGIGV